MRQVYRLLGLVRRHGAERVEDACARPGWITPTTRRCANCTGSSCSSLTTWLEAEAINIGLIDRMLTRGPEDQPATPPPTVVTASRFVRDSGDFSVRRPS
jgi:hypothetical protein